MSYHTLQLVQLDPEHASCIGGRTVLTCRMCAGNAPRGAPCGSCDGRGFTIFICAHCHPAAAAIAARTAASSASSTPESSIPSSPASLSRSSSTSVSPRSGTRPIRPYRRFGDGSDGPGSGKIGTYTPRSV